MRRPMVLSTVSRPLAVEAGVALHAGRGVEAGGDYRLQVGDKPGGLFCRHYRRGMATGDASCSQPGAPMGPVTHRPDLTTTVKLANVT